MTVLYTTPILSLKAFTPGTDWVDFNDNLTAVDTYFGTYIITDAMDANTGRTTFPMAPVNRMDYLFEFIKKAEGEITEDSVYMDVLQLWEENIMNWESVPVPYTNIPDNFNTTIQMIGNGLTFGIYARKDGTKFRAFIPSVVSLPEAHFQFGPFLYAETDIISASGEYILVYEEVTGKFIDKDQAATGDQFLPGQIWSGPQAVPGGSIPNPIQLVVNGYSYDEGLNASGITKYLDTGWAQGHDPDFFGNIDTIRPPGYLSFRTLGGDMYNASLLYIDALQVHLLTTEVGRFATLGDSVSNEMQIEADALDALIDRITDVDPESNSVQATLDKKIAIIDQQITDRLHVSNDYTIHTGDYAEFEIGDAIEFMDKKLELHHQNKTYAVIRLDDGVYPVSTSVVVTLDGAEKVVWRASSVGSIRYGTVTDDVRGDPVALTEDGEFRLAFAIGSTRMYLEVPYENPHDVHAFARSASDQGMVKGLNITYVPSED